MFRLNCSLMSIMRALAMNRASAISLSLAGIPEIASLRWSSSSVTPVAASAASMPTLSPGARVRRRMALSMAFRIALAKYFFG
jgi:hypothetical protein